MNIHVVYNPIKSFLIKLKEFFFLITFRDTFDNRLSYLLNFPLLPMYYLLLLIGCMVWVLWELLGRVVCGGIVLIFMALPFLLAIACGCIIFSVL